MCTLDPLPTQDPERLLRLARKAAAEAPDWSVAILERAYCRVGQPQKALDALGSADGYSLLGRAIAHRLLGQSEEARARLHEALGFFERVGYPTEANDRMEVEVLRHEAEGPISGQTDSPPNNGADGATTGIGPLPQR
jgi:hypothetical protein